jgi:hypothetical protein
VLDMLWLSLISGSPGTTPGGARNQGQVHVIIPDATGLKNLLDNRKPPKVSFILNDTLHLDGLLD